MRRGAVSAMLTGKDGWPCTTTKCQLRDTSKGIRPLFLVTCLKVDHKQSLRHLVPLATASSSSSVLALQGIRRGSSSSAAPLHPECHLSWVQDCNGKLAKSSTKVCLKRQASHHLHLMLATSTSTDAATVIVATVTNSHRTPAQQYQQQYDHGCACVAAGWQSTRTDASNESGVLHSRYNSASLAKEGKPTVGDTNSPDGGHPCRAAVDTSALRSVFMVCGRHWVDLRPRKRCKAGTCCCILPSVGSLRGKPLTGSSTSGNRKGKQQ